jgi:hypothetical protein
VAIAGGVAGGIATSPTGVGAVAGAGVSAVGVAATVHGVGVGKSAVNNLMNGKGSNSQKTPGQINQEKYLSVGKDKGYKDYIKNIYRKEATVGDGSTADYYRKYGDEGHKIKMENRIKQGERLLGSGRLTPEEAANVKGINQNMKNALSGR